MSIFKSTVVVVMLCLTLSIATPTPTYAAPMTDAERVELLASLRLQLIALLKQLIALQTGQAIESTTNNQTETTSTNSSSNGSSHSGGSSSSSSSHVDEDEPVFMIEKVSNVTSIYETDNSVSYKVEVTAAESDFTFTASANTNLSGAETAIKSTADTKAGKYELQEGETERVTVTVSKNSFTAGTSFTTTVTFKAYDEEGNLVATDPVTFTTSVQSEENLEPAVSNDDLGQLNVGDINSVTTVSSDKSSVSYSFELTADEDDVFLTVNTHTNLSNASVNVSSTADKEGSKYVIDEGNTERFTVKVIRDPNFVSGSSFTTTVTIDAEDSDGDAVDVDPIVFNTTVE